MSTVEQKEIKTIRPIKNNWYDWLINYISEFIEKGFKGKVIGPFKINTPKQIMYGKGMKLSKPKIL